MPAGLGPQHSTTNAQSPEPKTAVLLIAHGSRRPEANQDLIELARLLRNQTRFEPIEASYLELARPTIPDGGRRCVEQGAQRVLMLPYFLSAGTHVMRDLQRFRDELAAAFPSVDFRLCPPLGLHPRMMEIVLDRLQQGVGREERSAPETPRRGQPPAGTWRETSGR